MNTIGYCGIAERLTVPVEFQTWEESLDERAIMDWSEIPTVTIMVICLASKDGRCWNCTGKALVDERKESIGLVRVTRNAEKLREYEP